MMDVWEEEGPPIHMAVAGYLGLTKKKRKKKQIDDSDWDDLLNQFPGGMIN